MEIEIGDYIRTENGEIHKIIDTEKGSIKIKSNYKEWIGVCCIVKHSKNIIDLIEDEDIVILEYKTPRYQERITRKFEISKIEEYINFENKHCSFWCKVGDKKIVDNICKNIKIKSIVTKEMMKNVMYEV